jgi:xylose isomerase
MTLPNRPRYAARLNAFKGPGGTRGMIARAAAVPGIDAADLNYPDHLDGATARDMAAVLADCGLALNGLAMRYYGDPRLRLGAFTNPDRQVRQAAIDLTLRGADACREMGGGTLTLWLGQDGWDYPFQADYPRLWEDTAQALALVADHAPDLAISVEYKPDEPRAKALLPDMATTLLMLGQVGRANLGVTLDFCHSLYAGENPARAVTLAGARLTGVHLNDGYGRRDDGLVAGAIHPLETVELFVALHRTGWDGVVYFDTFPDHGGTDPAAEAAASIALTDRLRGVARALADDAALAAATAAQDAPAALRIVTRALYG